MSSPLHVTLYIQGSCVVPLNNNSYRREKIIWDHRDPACGCPIKYLLTGKTNPDGIYILCLEPYHHVYLSSTCTYKGSSGGSYLEYALISSAAIIIYQSCRQGNANVESMLGSTGYIFLAYWMLFPVIVYPSQVFLGLFFHSI